MDELYDYKQDVKEITGSEGITRKRMAVLFNNGYTVSTIRGRKAYASGTDVEVAIGIISYTEGRGETMDFKTEEVWLTLFGEELGDVVATCTMEQLALIYPHVAQMLPLPMEEN